MHDNSVFTRNNPDLFSPSVSVKIVEVAKKYDKPATSWTQGFLPGMIWLLLERRRLLASTVDPSYSEADLMKLGRRWQAGFEYLASPSIDHDQGFRFQLSFGHDYKASGDAHAREVVIRAADSLVDRFNEEVGSIRSWDKMVTKNKNYTRDNMQTHFLVIIDNMMNLDMLYMATDLTGDPKYAHIATRQAETSAQYHVRPDFTTYHVVNYDQATGGVLERITAQGYADDSFWSRGQAWGMYGYAQCGSSGVPEWDFKAPKPAPYDASAATIAARALQMLSDLLEKSEPEASKEYLSRANKLIGDTIRECLMPEAKLKGGKVDFGEGGWETILGHSTINGNPRATRTIMDHGLVCLSRLRSWLALIPDADYYFVEFGNEALKKKLGRK